MGLLSQTTHKNKLKMDYKLKWKTWNHKTPRRKHRHYALWHWSQKYFSGYVSSGKTNNFKNKWMKLHQTKTLSHSEGNYQQNENAAYLERYLQMIYLAKG